MTLLAFLAGLPPSIVYFACFVIILTVVGAFALRLGLEEDAEFYHEVGPDGKVRVAFAFPPSETREQRRRRWARALRKRFWAGLAKCDAASARHTEADVNRFLAALLDAAASKPGAEASTKGAAAAAGAVSLPPTAAWDACDRQVEYMVYQPPTAPPPLAPEEAGKIKKRLFSVVMNAGPPKALPPITEEQAPLVADVEAGPSPPTTKISSAEATQGKGPSPWDMILSLMQSKPEKQNPTTWTEFDSEPIMMVGDVAATRALLWASLRKLETMQSKDILEAAGLRQASQ